MDKSNYYKLMCLKAKEIQKMWKPEIGDYIVSKAKYYCDNAECTENEPCEHCLDMCNIYVISGTTKFSEEIGGQHWFYGGSWCARNGENVGNSTFCFIMTNNGESNLESKYYRSKKSKMLWLPRQDQIQQFSNFVSGFTDHKIARVFIEWLDTATYNPYTYSLEMLWLMFYMEKRYNKIWNAISNIQEWQLKG